MKIEQANQLAALQQLSTGSSNVKVLPARVVAKKVIRAAATMGIPKEESAERWANKWLASNNFVLVEIDAGRVACPLRIDKKMVQRLMACSANDTEPIVIDVNKNKIGEALNGYVPKVIICAGGESQKSLIIQGHQRVKAWVGKRALRHLFGSSADAIHADTEFSSSELQNRLSSLLQDKYPVPKGQYNNIYVRDVYPLESYCVYSNDGKLYKQLFKVEDVGGKREIQLDGTPLEVREAYIDAGREKKSKLEACAMLNGYMRDPHFAGRVNPTFGATRSAINLGIKAKKDDKHGTKLDRLLVKFRAAVKDGWVPPIQGKSPKGWEDTVEKMKEDAPSIDNPFALAYWMKDQGYEPHHPPGSEDKKKK